MPENYVHRIGRTARAGAEGKAVAFCSAAEFGLLRAVEKLMNISVETAGGVRPERAQKFVRPKSGKPAGKPSGKPSHKHGAGRAKAYDKPYDPMKAASRRNAAKKRAARDTRAA